MLERIPVLETVKKAAFIGCTGESGSTILRQWRGSLRRICNDGKRRGGFLASFMTAVLSVSTDDHRNSRSHLDEEVISFAKVLIYKPNGFPLHQHSSHHIHINPNTATLLHTSTFVYHTPKASTTHISYHSTPTKMKGFNSIMALSTILFSTVTYAQGCEDIEPADPYCQLPLWSDYEVNATVSRPTTLET